MQLLTRTAPIRELSHGTIVDLPGIGPAVYYFDHVDTKSDETIWKPQFSIPHQMVLREYDEVVPVIATPLEAALMFLLRMAQSYPEQVAENSPPTPRRYTSHMRANYWFYPRDIAIGSIVLTQTNGMAVYRGMLPSSSGDQKATCYTYNGSIVELPVNRRVYTKCNPVVIAWDYLKHNPHM